MYTVVMVTRPHEPYIGEALDSIQAQVLPPDEVIVVVNGPDADDAGFAATIVDRCPGAEVRTLPTPSMSGALAHAFGRVASPFVAVLDADDLWLPDKQRCQVDRLVAEPALDAVYCTAVNFRVEPDGTTVDGLTATARMFGATTFRTDVFARFGAPDPTASHFAWLFRWWSAAQAAGIRAEGMEFPGLRRRVHDGNGWVVDRSRGREALLAELRRLGGTRATSQVSQEVT